MFHTLRRFSVGVGEKNDFLFIIIIMFNIILNVRVRRMQQERRRKNKIQTKANLINRCKKNRHGRHMAKIK